MWQSLYMRAINGSGFPQTCFQIQPALQNQPYFPDDLDLKLTYSHLSVSGTSTWKGSSEHCNIPPVERHLEIPVSIDCPTPLSVSADLDQSHQEWFNTDENHLPVLIFAWSYIFSARWAELMPEAILAYTNSKACNSGKHREQGPALIDVGVVTDNAARWWAAILAPGEGWQAYIAIGKDKFRSPWSISLPASSAFGLFSDNKHCMLSDTVISAATAFRFLSDYCALHDIVDQGYAALSAVLFLPLLHHCRKDIVLPRPKFSHEQKGKVGSSRCRMQLDLSCVQETHHLDKLLTLSCNTGGIRTLLSSVFYEPGIACNVVSPWLQSIFAVINSVDDNRILTHMLMTRVPRLAFLWLGGAIMDIYKEVLQYAPYGLILTDLHAAAWSGTVQSFMQEPIHSAENDCVLRSDECRILYLTQEEHHTRWPICQWAPFGATALKDTDIDVRLHANCTGHSLQYAGWKWMCRNGRVVHQLSEPSLAPTFPLAEPIMPNITVNYEALNYEEECASVNATRSMFGWLRFEGYPPDEKKIHEWIYLDHPNRRLSPDRDSGEGHRASRTDVEDWIDHNVCIYDEE